MDNDFIIKPKPEIVFGRDSLEELKRLTKNYNNIMLVYGQHAIKNMGLYEMIVTQLDSVTLVELPGVTPNPRLSMVYTGIELVNKNNIDLILAVGGGSVIDCAKAIALGAHNLENDIWDIITKNLPTTGAIDIATIPTLVATGSETNDIFVIFNDEINLKRSLRNHFVTPKFSILNPMYTRCVNKRNTVNGIVDTLSHILEQAVNNKVDNLFNLQLAFYFKRLMEKGALLVDNMYDYDLRSEHMIIAMEAYNGDFRSKLGGDWACHGLDYGLASEFDNAHGEGLAIIIPNWLNYIANKYSDTYDLANFFRYAFDLDGEDYDVLIKASSALRTYFNRLNAPATFADINIDVDDEKIVVMAQKAMFINPLGNTFNLNQTDIVNIYKLCQGEI